MAALAGGVEVKVMVWLISCCSARTAQVQDRPRQRLTRCQCLMPLAVAVTLTLPSKSVKLGVESVADAPLQVV